MSESRPPSHRCPTCKSTLVNARNLAVFIDGTSNKPDPQGPNVLKLFNRVKCRTGDHEPGQLRLYLTSIGVYEVDANSPLLSRVKKDIYSHLGIAFAWNVERNVKAAYAWLAQHYREGDQIYLFGFSWGAYQVRELAAMIHEVGLVNVVNERIEQAYHVYRSIDPSNPESRHAVIEFKKAFCWYGVRIHFVGVWDTVSSLSLIERGVHVTASASVTNSCHFRHALALDERRINFTPEYFVQVNTHGSNIRSPRLAVSDVKEVWFAGNHFDVGGTSKRRIEGDDRYPTHPGNVPHLWMKREAVANGLVFGAREEFSWDPRDVDLGRKETGNIFWRFIETWPIRHQVAFNGTGNHTWRWHMFRPRSVIPRQHIHSSILVSRVYTPRATQRSGVCIPIVSRTTSGGLWITDLAGEGTTRSFTRLLRDPQATTESLEKALFRLGCDYQLLDNEQTQTETRSQLSEEFIKKQFGLARFAFAVYYAVTSDTPISEELVEKARNSLIATLSSPDLPYFSGTLDVLLFLARNETPRRRFIAHEGVIKALLRALERTAKSQNENLFLSVMEILRYFINCRDQRGNVINQLGARSDATKTRKTRLSLILEVKTPSHLMAALKMVVSLVHYTPALCEELKPRIIELAKKASGLVGSAAVEALVAFNGPQLTRNIPFSNVLAYLDNTLPRLDVEVGSTSPPDSTATSPPVFLVNAGLDDKDMIMHELTRAIQWGGVHQRTVATLTLLKLCKYTAVQNYGTRNKTLEIFMKQLKRRETSLLAAYALKTCLTFNMYTSDFNFPRAAQLIVGMLDKGWFDDAIGQVEGSEIFRELMTFDDLNQQVIKAGIVSTMIKMFERGDCHNLRMSLVCLDILVRKRKKEVAEELTTFVTKSLDYLQSKKRTKQMKGVKVLSALARTVAGEEAITPHVTGIVKMLLPRGTQSPVPRSQLFGPTCVLHNLCRNESLRKQIQESREFREFKARRGDKTLYPARVL